MSWSSLCVLAALATGARADDNVTVLRKTLPLEEEHALQLDRSIEYILLFEPTMEQSAFPVRVWLRSEGGGDVNHPLLVTARHRTGATTWQLPYRVGTAQLHELQRMLCEVDSPAEPSHCEDVGAAGAGAGLARRGAFSLHVAASCADPATLRLRAAPAYDVALLHTAQVTATIAAPSVVRFSAWGAAHSVRLAVASQDDVCATLAVQPVSCPVAQTADQIAQTIVRMTVQRSGGLQLAKSRYPLGFYIITLVGDSDRACSREEVEADEEEDWLWQAAVLNGSAGAGAGAAGAAGPRVKRLSFEIKEALSWREYLTGTGVALAFFLAWYLAFGALVLAQRWPVWYNLVAPRAPKAEALEADGTMAADGTTAADGAASPSPPRPGSRRRRDSTATFDSSDASDSDSDGERTDATAVAETPAPPEAAASPTPAPHDDTPAPEDGASSPRTLTPPPPPPPPPSNGHIVQVFDWSDGLPPTDGQRATAAAAADADTGVDERGGARTRPSERAFGLPARLHVARLARRRGRVLRARSQRYLYALSTVAVFYALPVLQFVAAFQLVLNVSGSLDLCYYNWLCAHPLGALYDFNHVYSNLGYLLLGALYMVQLRRRRRRAAAARRPDTHGLPPHYGLCAALGAGMIVVALLSASYHVCPNALNFQFDTAFMYVLAVLSCVKIYQARHPDINARAHATFGVLAILIALVVWGVLGGGPLFWSVFTVLHVFTFLLLSLRIYYLGQFRLEAASVAEAARALRAPPLYRARLGALVAANAVHWAFALYGLLVQPEIASHLLFVLLANALMHMLYYVGMKLAHGERMRWYAWLYSAGAVCAWAPALYLFRSGSTDWSAAPARSRHLNHECRLLSFYDAHDLWHMLSAVALYLTFNAMLAWDDGLAAYPRTHIHVF